ncbi:N-acetylmuramoyl-L-alanine amidase-like domain-containing protein [Parabacteroides pacaensis]|uniref:N-acetylmuramoyl-L-alanine amidase-like domain-containing protein n=1 Tax=Parabacteroides pacaensis TaxID=2086575 RepID=UPI000D0F52F7|nr:N-acetylmuramoyl-L-alanine amidase-like domain-containing protein [Parabacteroides pacaensis]
MKQWFITCLLLFGSLSFTKGQINYCKQDKEIFAEYLEQFQPKYNLSLNEIVIETAKFFQGTPYVASTLEKEPEQLIINFREFDCMTFVETTLALAKMIKSNTPKFESYGQILQSIRYHNKKIKNYTSRKHYTTDWINENENEGLVKNVTRQLDGIPLPVEVSFMSTHPDKYKQLAKNPSLVPFIQEKEKEINQRSYYYIPKKEIYKVINKIQDGDIICFTTTIKELDISHVGYAYWEKDQLTFIHASTSAHKVIINPKSLIDYISEIKHNNGIIVVRPL